MQSHRTARGVGALLGTVTLLFGASGVFAELQASLDSICRLKKARSTQSVLATLLEALRAKAFSFVIVVAAAVALLVSLVVSTALSAAGNGVAGIFGEGWFLFEETASIAFLTVLLAAIYRMVPHEHMAWGDVLGGALLTSLLFAGLKRLLAFYLVHLASYAAYGVVGGILGLLTWIYIANLMLFYGAEFSRVYAERLGSLRGAGATLPRESRKLTGSCPDL